MLPALSPSSAKLAALVASLVLAPANASAKVPIPWFMRRDDIGTPIPSLALRPLYQPEIYDTCTWDRNWDENVADCGDKTCMEKGATCCASLGSSTYCPTGWSCFDSGKYCCEQGKACQVPGADGTPVRPFDSASKEEWIDYDGQHVRRCMGPGLVECGEDYCRPETNVCCSENYGATNCAAGYYCVFGGTGCCKTNHTCPDPLPPAPTTSGPPTIPTLTPSNMKGEVGIYLGWPIEKQGLPSGMRYCQYDTEVLSNWWSFAHLPNMFLRRYGWEGLFDGYEEGDAIDWDALGKAKGIEFWRYFCRGTP